MFACLFDAMLLGLLRRPLLYVDPAQGTPSPFIPGDLLLTELCARCRFATLSPPHCCLPFPPARLSLSSQPFTTLRLLVFAAASAVVLTTCLARPTPAL